MIKQTALATVLGLAMFASQPAKADIPPEANHSNACFFNSYASWEVYMGCVYVGENVPNATLRTANGTYYVTCTGGGGCNFTWQPNRPGPGFPQEP